MFLTAYSQLNKINQQGPTLTFEGTCPFGQSDPKIYLPGKKIQLAPQNVILHFVHY